jgi:hypothetical protein
MSLTDVETQWPTYQLMIKALYTGINNPPALKDAAANIGLFPEADPGAWYNWMTAFRGLGTLNDAVQITDVTLQAMANFVAATNLIAATVTLPAPSQPQVSSLITQLKVVNQAIQTDERFAAALKIGKALTGNISSNLKKA